MDRLTSAERHDFAQEIAIVSRRWRTRLDERLKPLDMSQARWGALYWLGLAEGEGISQATLAERAGVEPPTMVRVLDQLEAQGLIERRTSPTDRRVNLLHLTAAATPLVSRIEGVAEDLRQELMAEMSLDEFRAAMCALRKLREKLD
jgi:MarR family transcriptional regulator for hemolysin